MDRGRNEEMEGGENRGRKAHKEGRMVEVRDGLSEASIHPKPMMHFLLFQIPPPISERISESMKNVPD